MAVARPRPRTRRETLNTSWPWRVRDALAAQPRALWACTAVGLAHALVWAALIPTFQGPDEPVHVGYTQYIAETGDLPRPLSPYYTPPEDADALFGSLRWSLTEDPNWSPAHHRDLVNTLDDPGLSREDERGAGYAANNPALYYVLTALPYRAAAGRGLLDRIFAMRVFSALFAAATVAFVFLFLRGLLPRHPWSWTIGSLAVALQPVAAFIGGTVNNDTMLWTASAALFWLVARGFRRGLTLPLGVAIGAALATALLTKGGSYGLVPGTVVALAVMFWRAGEGRRRALVAGVASLAVVAMTFGAWVLASRYVFDRAGTSVTGGAIQPENAPLTVGGYLSYLWQTFLPPLSFMRDWFSEPRALPVWDVYFQGFVGRFGWFQFGFPPWVNWVGLAVVAVLALLAAKSLLDARVAVLRRRGELVAYLAFAVGMLFVVTAAGYRARVLDSVDFEQTRYLFPLLPLWGAFVVLAVRGAGRFYRAAGVLVIAVLGIHAVHSVLLTLARYYA